MIDDPNFALKETLKTYVADTREPGYAIMITGSWGVGKTFLISQFIKDGIANVNTFYVSLYGVCSRDDFDNAVLAAVYPYVNTKIAKISKSVATAVANTFRLKLDLKLADIVDTIQAGVFIFDDLERLGSGLDVQTVMGYINKYIEHAGCRVILVGNEEEITNSDIFQKTKEKLIGRTIRVKPATSKALDHYLETISGATCKAFLIKHRAMIENVYQLSKVNNLRILKQALRDIEQFFECFEEKHTQNESSLHDTIRLFYVFALEAKQGKLSAEQLLIRNTSLHAAAARSNDKNYVKSIFDELNDRYPEIDVYDTVLTNKVLKAMIFDGDFSRDVILQSLEDSYRFAAPQDEPEWKTVWHGTLRDDKYLEPAAKAMESKYAAKEYVVPGILLHVFTQRLWLSEIGYISDGEAEIIGSAKTYIDYLFEKNLLEPLDTNLRFANTWDSFESLSFSRCDEKPFKDVSSYLLKRQIDAFERSMAQSVPYLMEMMKSDIDQFVTNLLPFNGAESRFGHHPILAQIDPKEFANAIFSIPVISQHKVFMLLSNRYKNNLFDTDLKREKVWLKKLRKEIQTPMASMPPFTSDRLSRFIKWYLDPHLKNIPKKAD